MVKLRNYLTITFFSLFLSIALGQKEIMVSGTVTNDLNEPIPNIDVLLKTNDSLSLIVAFAITDDFGRFKIIHQTNRKSLLLVTSSLVHETLTKKIVIDKNALKIIENFKLKNRVEELEEVEIRAAPRVIVKNDTTIFNLEKLTDGTERVVEEILQKLPGVVIDSRGRLQFKGKNVSNVLLDGDNLFNGNYTVGTKRINASHIKGIEAIENFEENSLLQGLSENDIVALNLKFGKGVSLSGDAEASYANGNRFSLNTTVITVSKPLKAFGIASFNSIGNDLENSNFDATEFIDKLREQHSNGLDAPSYVGDNSNLFPENNSISNNEYFGSINLLPKISDTETLRLNIDALADRSLEQRSQLTLIGNGENDTIRIEERNSNLIKPNYFNSSIYFQKFASSSKSWTTTIKFSKLRNERQLLGIRNEQQQGENTIFNDVFVSNNSTYTLRIDDTKALKLEGLMAYSEKPEYLTLFSGIDFNTYSPILGESNNQSSFSRKQQVRLISNYYQKISENDKFNLKLKTTYFKNTLRSTLSNTEGNTAFENDIDYEVLVPEISAEYFLKLSNFSFRPSIKLKLFTYNYNDATLSRNHNNSKGLMDAYVRFNYHFDKRNSISTRLEYLNEIPNEENLYTNFILRSNRRLVTNELNFENLRSSSASIYYNYNNLIKDTNLSLGFRYNKNNNTYLITNTINSYVNVITNIGFNNSSVDRIWSFNFSKYINPLRSTIRFNSSYNNSNYVNIVNDSELRFNTMESLNTHLAIGTSFIGKFLFGNNLTYTKTDFSNFVDEGFSNQGIINKFNVTYVPKSNLRIVNNLNYTVPNLDNGSNNTLTLNSSILLENKKKTISYTLEGRNLLNQSFIGNVSNNDFSTTIIAESLFDRLILLTINFKY
ncbi:hypothetical protein Q2T41_12495 [Maribacter confluentis]|uniref:TonB-dependent receptor n=1 Tax=Maribacter confluentis TaxID=1656093 RepID=A0ABT8RRH5_9FLAO|nr:hypothetical protein [Maribacter confluentis]MDO1513474.1 hypothetical protein [Maribacter confluentis]